MALTEKLITDMQKFCEQEDQTLWDQGDALVTASLSDAEMEKLAEKVQRTVGTLRDRERVAREVPVSRRDKRHSFYVYATLITIKDESERWRLLDSRQEWTTNAMTLAAREWKITNDRANKLHVKSSQTSKGGMRLNDLKIKGEGEPGQAILTLDAPRGFASPEAAEIHRLTDTRLQIVINFQ